MHNLFDAVSALITHTQYRKGRHAPYMSNGYLITTAPVDSDRTGKMWFILTQDLENLSTAIVVRFHQTKVMEITPDYLYVNVLTHVEHPSHRRWCEMLFALLRSVYPIEMRFVSYRQDPLRYNKIERGRVTPTAIKPDRQWRVRVTLNGQVTHMREASVLAYQHPLAVDYTTGENASQLMQSVALNQIISSAVEGARALVAAGKQTLSDFRLIPKPYWDVKKDLLS